MLFPNSEPINGFIETGGAGGYQAHSPATYHNVASPKYPLGTIIGYFNATLHGYGACVYAQCDEVSSGSIVVGRVLTLKSSYGTILTDDASAGMVGTYQTHAGVPAAIAMSTMTTDYYGWFWIMGCCPDLYTAAGTSLSANTGITSGGSIAADCAFIASTTDGAIAVYDADAANVDVEPMGFALAADSTNANTFSNIRLYGTGWGI